MKINARRMDVLEDPRTNRGTAFTLAERHRLGLEGLLPSVVEGIEQQASRCYEQYSAINDAIDKWSFLTQLHDTNEILYYRLVLDHVAEMLPIVYTPTVGAAIEQFSHLFRRPRGLFLDIDHPEQIGPALEATGLEADDVDLVVASDGGAILGIGDWGVGGIDIFSIPRLLSVSAGLSLSPTRARAGSARRRPLPRSGQAIPARPSAATSYGQHPCRIDSGGDGVDGASGKLVTGSAICQAMALGADWANSARAFMMAVGCIQAQRCHTNRCPVGVTTQDPRLQRALDVPDKAKRVHQYHRNTVSGVAEIVAAMGYDHPSELTPDDVYRRVSETDAQTFAEIYPFAAPGSLLDGSAAPRFQRRWDRADASSFRPNRPEPASA